MNHPETFESVECVTCGRCGNTVASDADECARCGAVIHTAPWNTDRADNLQVAAEPHPQRLRRAHVPSPYPSIREEVVPRSSSTRRKGRAGLRSAAVIVVIGMFVTVFAYIAAGKFERASASQHVSASGTVMALAPGKTSAESDIKRVTAPPPVPIAAVDTSIADVSPPADVNATRVAKMVAGVRYALKRGDLTDARDRLAKLPASLQTNPEARPLVADLNRRERERDASLQRARWCEEGKDWSCVAQNAAHVQTLDTGNVESRVMLSNAVIKLGSAGRASSNTPNSPALASMRPRSDNQ